MIQRLLFLDHQTVVQVARLGEKFYSKTGLSGSFRHETFSVMWNKCLSMGIAATWVTKKDEVITGIIGMSLSFGIMDGRTLAEETFWFVDPEHRGRDGLRLFVAAEEWARDVGAHSMTMSCMQELNPEKLEKFYTSHEYRKLQTMYIKDLNDS